MNLISHHKPQDTNDAAAQVQTASCPHGQSFSYDDLYHVVETF